MIIFFDGSCTRHHPKTAAKLSNPVLSWGIHIESDSTITEVYDHKVVSSALKGVYETVALVEAVKCAILYNKPPNEVSFYTDDEVTVYGAQQWLQSYGTGSAYAASLERNLIFLRKLYPSSVLDSVIPYLQHSRFIKVAGHTNVTNNLRVDYLAKRARNMALGLSSNVVAYESWLNSAQ